MRHAIVVLLVMCAAFVSSACVQMNVGVSAAERARIDAAGPMLGIAVLIAGVVWLGAVVRGARRSTAVPQLPVARARVAA